MGQILDGAFRAEQEIQYRQGGLAALKNRFISFEGNGTEAGLSAQPVAEIFVAELADQFYGAIGTGNINAG